MEAKIDEKSALGPSRAPLAPKRRTKPQNDAKRYPKSLQKVPKMTLKGTPNDPTSHASPANPVYLQFRALSLVDGGRRQGAKPLR